MDSAKLNLLLESLGLVSEYLCYEEIHVLQSSSCKLLDRTLHDSSGYLMGNGIEHSMNAVEYGSASRIRYAFA